MAGILESLNYTIDILEEEKNFFWTIEIYLKSKKLEVLKPIYTKFNILYNRLRENLNDIIAASSDSEDIKRMDSRGELMEKIKWKSVVEQGLPYLKQSYPPLIKKAVTHATGIPIPLILSNVCRVI